MPTFRVTSPDGAVYEVNAPEGATEQDAIAYVQSQHANGQDVDAAAVNHDDIPQTQKDLAMQAVSSADTSLPARLTAYGANAVSNIPGLKEFGSAAAAGLGYGQGDTFGDRYDNLQGAQKAMREAGAVTDPSATTMGNVSGTVLGMGIGGKAIRAITPDVVAARAAAFAASHPYLSTAAVGGPTSALYGFANGENADARVHNAAIDGFIGTVASVPAAFVAQRAIAPLVGKLAQTPVGQKVGDYASRLSQFFDDAPANTLPQKSLFTPASQGSVITPEISASAPASSTSSAFANTPTARDLKGLSSSMYQDAAEKGGVLTPEFTNKFIDEINALKPQTAIGKIVGGKSDFSKFADDIAAIKDRPMSLDELQELDEMIGDAVDSHFVNGSLNKQGKKILDIQSALREMVNNADESQIVGGKEGFDALKGARKAWAQSRKMADLERIQARADNMEQPTTGIKSGVRTLLNNPKRKRGYTQAEKDALKAAGKTGIISDALRLAGSGLVPIGGGVAGGVPGAAVGYAVQQGAKSIAHRLQLNKLDAAKRAIASPYMQQAEPKANLVWGSMTTPSLANFYREAN